MCRRFVFLYKMCFTKLMLNGKNSDRIWAGRVRRTSVSLCVIYISNVQESSWAFAFFCFRVAEPKSETIIQMICIEQSLYIRGVLTTKSDEYKLCDFKCFLCCMSVWQYVQYLTKSNVPEDTHYKWFKSGFYCFLSSIVNKKCFHVINFIMYKYELNSFYSRYCQLFY